MAGCKLFFFLTYMFGHCSSWLVVAINIERMICTNLPHKAMIFISRLSQWGVLPGYLHRHALVNWTKGRAEDTAQRYHNKVHIL